MLKKYCKTRTVLANVILLGLRGYIVNRTLKHFAVQFDNGHQTISIDRLKPGHYDVVDHFYVSFNTKTSHTWSIKCKLKITDSFDQTIRPPYRLGCAVKSPFRLCAVFLHPLRNITRTGIIFLNNFLAYLLAIKFSIS